ncbi:MAG: hypothetical protein ACKO0M_03280 [Cyanobium sp.]
MSRARPAAIRALRAGATPLVLAALLLPGLISCGPSRDLRSEQRQRAAEQRRRALASQCRRDRALLPPLIEALRGREQELAALEAETYRPSAGPSPLDPDEQRRLAVYDQEIEQEQYDQAYAAWQDREAQRRAAWRSDRRERLTLAREQRAAAAAALEARAPELFPANDPAQLDQTALQRRLSCGALPR